MNCPYCIKICGGCGELLVANSINFHKANGKYGVRNKCKVCRKNDDEEKMRKKEYYKKNKNWLKEKNKEYRKNNKEKEKERFDKWKKNNPDKEFNRYTKRRQREENQGGGISKNQWLEMMEFFDWRCAYSNEKLSDKYRTIDHIIPLSKGGENEIWNCIPMHRSYNSSKFTNDMLEWYQQQEFYSEERLNKIYKWIEYAKNKWKNSNK